MKKESPKRKYWWVDESICDGYHYQHGDDFVPVYMTLREFREVEKTHLYNGVYGKIFKTALAASYYVNN